jgi:D-aminopeptidase
VSGQGAGRARDLGIVVGRGVPGPLNALTDVPGVRVGHCTLVEGSGPLQVGVGPVRTGVTVIVPTPDPLWERAVYAGAHRLNGNGEMTGLEWVRESGLLTTPIGLTNSHSVGVVRDALVRAEIASRPQGLYWSLPVVGETWDGLLNDINGLHVRPEHVDQALAAAAGGPVAEGAVGSGTGMVCHGFKGGIGTASRVVADGYTLGVLVQANHGRRERLTVNGAPVGRAVDGSAVPLPAAPEEQPVPEGGGSILVILATDAPLLPHQCDRVAQRAALGIARTGGTGEHFSGDLVLAFATGNRPEPARYGRPQPMTQNLTVLSDGHLDPLFDAAVEATEEAILNCLLAAVTTTGRDGVTAHALPPDLLLAVLDRRGAREPA